MSEETLGRVPLRRPGLRLRLPPRPRNRDGAPPSCAAGLSFQQPCSDIEKTPRIPIGADEVII